MVGVGETLVDDCPGLFVFESLLIDENSEKFNDSESRVSIIELESAFFGNETEVGVQLLETTHDVADRR